MTPCPDIKRYIIVPFLNLKVEMTLVMPHKAATRKMTLVSSLDLKCSDIFFPVEVDTGFNHIGWSWRKSRWKLFGRLFILRSSLLPYRKQTAEGRTGKLNGKP